MAHGPPLEDIILGGDKSPPEHDIAGQYACDPCPTDIYFLGNLIRREFLDGQPDMHEYGKLGIEFTRPVVYDMAQADPAKRRTIDRVVAGFVDIQKGLSVRKLRARVLGGREHPYLSPSNWYRRIQTILMRASAAPVPSSQTITAHNQSLREGVSSWDGIRKGVHTCERGAIQE